MSEKWWVVFAAFLCLVFMFAVPTFMIPVLFSPIIDEFGWSRTQVSLFATVKFGAGAMVGVMFGFLLDRLSIRKIVFFSGTLSGLAMIAFLGINSLTTFYTVGLALGMGAVGTMIAMKVLVSRCFRERQGFAMGIALLGTSVGGAFIRALTPQLLNLEIGSRALGWRGSVAIMSAGVWFVALPTFLWIVRDEMTQPEPAATTPDPKSDGDFSDVLTSPTFWMLGLAVLLIGFVDQAVAQHFVLFLDKDVGLGLAAAASAASVASLISIGGKVGFGWFYDKLSVKGVMVCYMLMAISVLIAIPAQGTLLLGALIFTRGLSHGGAIVDIPVLSKHCFGPKSLGRIIGLLTACVTLGFAAGPPTIGYLYDTQGTYRYAFMLLAVMAVAAGLVVLMAKPTYWETHIKGARSKEPSTSTAPAV